MFDSVSLGDLTLNNRLSSDDTGKCNGRWAGNFQDGTVLHNVRQRGILLSYH